MHIAENCVVSFHYTLTNDAGEQIDSSSGRDPLVYLHGASNIIPGLEDALSGRSAGDEFQVTVEPGRAYGERNVELVQNVPLEAFREVGDVAPGMQFQVTDPEGRARRIVVVDVSDEVVRIDANHPLAGERLHFEVRIEAVREATEDEVAHGHPH